MSQFDDTALHAKICNSLIIQIIGKCCLEQRYLSLVRSKTYKKGEIGLREIQGHIR